MLKNHPQYSIINRKLVECWTYLLGRILADEQPIRKRIIDGEFGKRALFCDLIFLSVEFGGEIEGESSIRFDDFTMFSQYFVSRTGHGFLSICRVCIPSELVRFRGDLGGLFCCRSRFASFQFRSCNGIQHVLMGATKPKNGAADCRRNTTETLLRQTNHFLRETENLLRQTDNFLRETENHSNVTENLLRQTDNFLRESENHSNVMSKQDDYENYENDLQTNHLLRGSTIDIDKEYIFVTTDGDNTTNVFAKIVPGSECENDTDINHANLQADSKSELIECMKNHRHSLLCLKYQSKKNRDRELLEYH